MTDREKRNLLDQEYAELRGPRPLSSLWLTPQRVRDEFGGDQTAARERFEALRQVWQSGRDDFAGIIPNDPDAAEHEEAAALYGLREPVVFALDKPSGAPWDHDGRRITFPKSDLGAEAFACWHPDQWRTRPGSIITEMQQRAIETHNRLPANLHPIVRDWLSTLDAETREAIDRNPRFPA